jgi:hypothetical protein
VDDLRIYAQMIVYFKLNPSQILLLPVNLYLYLYFKFKYSSSRACGNCGKLFKSYTQRAFEPIRACGKPVDNLGVVIHRFFKAKNYPQFLKVIHRFSTEFSPENREFSTGFWQLHRS